MDDKLHVQIADFGLTRLCEATNTRSGALHLNFASPELFGFSENEDNFSNDTPARTQMSDVYAFGCVYYEVGHNNIADDFSQLPRFIMIAYLFLANRILKFGHSSFEAYFLLD